MEFLYSINNFEYLMALIEYDILVIGYLRSRAIEVEEFNKNRAWYIKKKKIGYTYKPEASDYFKDKAGIYMFINKINKKVYIGKSNDLFTRINFYTKKTSKTSSFNSKIFKALGKYGFNNFAFSIIEYCPVEELSKREQYYIDMIKPQYNIRRKTFKEYFDRSVFTVK